MISKNKIKQWALALSVMLSASACSDWLSVDMEDSIMEDQLYESNDGYLYALNGVYAKMNETYASTLSMGAIDVMAQYYDVSQNSSHADYAFANYKQDQFKGTSNLLWINLYSLIANLNVLIEHCDDSESALTQLYYPYVKGEALALRAFFHFDLMRLYGPIYDESTAGKITIPYQETSSKDIQPLLPASQVMEKIIRDLSQAADLLKEDRIRTEGVMAGESENPNESMKLRYRQYRMNYYAIQTMLARVYLWMGNKEKAGEIAKAFIEEEKGKDDKKVFPWTPKAVVADTKKPDRLFSSEVIFGLYNTSRVDLFDRKFKKTSDMRSILAFPGEDLGEGVPKSKLTYFYDDMGDIRRENMWTVEEITQSGSDGGGTSGSQKMLCFNKYEDFSGAAARYMIPLIRMSEMYLIAAECESDPEVAIGYVNAIRSARNCVDIKLPEADKEAAVSNAITKEFMREVIGEGQLYFYYKRHAMTTILAGNGFGDEWSGGLKENTITMNLGDYVWNLPEVEIDKRVESSK